MQRDSPAAVDLAGYITMIASPPRPVNTWIRGGTVAGPVDTGLGTAPTAYSLIHTKSVLDIASLIRASSS